MPDPDQDELFEIEEQPAPGRLRKSGIARPINREGLRARILALAEKHRPAASFDRVAESSLEYVETEVERFVDRLIKDELHRHPTRGKTICIGR